MRRALLAIALVALLAAPAALAHIPGARPILQRGQFERVVGLDPDGLELHVDLTLSNDPLRHLVQHDLAVGGSTEFEVQHREDGSQPGDTFFLRWGLDRLVEFRDHNVDGKYQPATDTAVKSWRLVHYQWRLAAIQRVEVGGVQSQSVVWEGDLTGAPHVRLEAVAAGKDFTDEGAIVRPQDVIIYLDFLEMPTRGLGSLYALEGRVVVRDSTQLSFHVAENVTTALLADAPLRRALVVWGGEATLDGREQVIATTLEDERVEFGNRTARVVWHLPTTDESIRLIAVTAVEYGTESRRSPLGAWVVLASAVAVALLWRRR